MLRYDPAFCSRKRLHRLAIHAKPAPEPESPPKFDRPIRGPLSFKMRPWRMEKFQGGIAVCTRCGVCMDDTEPMSQHGDYWHPKNGCVNGGKYHTLMGGRPFNDIQPFSMKRVRRARARGAKLAKKFRSR